MRKKDLLLQDWKECIQHIRFFKDQTNKMYLWELGLLPVIGIGIAIKFFSDGNVFLSSVALLALSPILGYADFIIAANVRDFRISKEISEKIEKELGTSLEIRMEKSRRKNQIRMTGLEDVKIKFSISTLRDGLNT